MGASFSTGIASVLSTLWLTFTEQGLLESPVAFALLLTGGWITSHSLLNMWRIKKYVHYSVMTNDQGPARSEQDNQNITTLLSQADSKASLTYSGLTIKNTSDFKKDGTDQKQKIFKEIQNMEKVVLPDIVLNSNIYDLSLAVHERWLTEITYPLALLNIFLIASKDPKDRRLDDYVVLASAFKTIKDTHSDPTLEQRREDFTQALKACQSAEEILKILIDHHILNEGGMSFLKEWIKEQERVSIRIGRGGSTILYKQLSSSIGGPYPVKLFPLPKKERERETLEPSHEHTLINKK